MAAQDSRSDGEASKTPAGGSVAAGVELSALSVESSPTLGEAFTRLLDSLALVVRYDSAALFVLNNGVLIAKSGRGFRDADSLLELTLPLKDYPIDREIVETQRPVVLEDVHLDPRWCPGAPLPDSPLIRAWMGIPLVSSGRTIGMLAVDSHSPGVYGPETLATAQAFVDLASVAVENARLYSEAGRRLRELDAVNRIGEAIRSRLEVEELCTVAGEGLLKIFGAGIVFVALYDEEAGLISTPYFWMENRRWNYPAFPYGSGLSSKIISGKKTIYLSTAGENRASLREAVLRAAEPPKSWLGVPMLAGGEAIGVLSVQSFEEENAFSAEDIRLLETIAATVGAGIANARLFVEAKRRADQAAALAEAGREISESLDLPVVLGRITERAAALLTLDTTAVYLEEEDGSYRATVASGPSAKEVMAYIVAPRKGIIGRVVASGRPEIVNDTMADPRAVFIPGTPEDVGGEKLLVAPLMGRSRVIGAMTVWRGAREAPFRKADLEFLMGLARRAEAAIENARLHERAKDSARRNAELYREARQARAEAEEANRLKSQFLAAMSHELRTPLNSVINFAYLLSAGSEGKLSVGQAELVGRIEDAGKHLLNLINDILDLAKIESGRMELCFEDIEFHHLAEGVLSTAAGLVHGKDVELVEEVPTDLPPIRADRTRVRQVLLNLLSNAAKFTERGRIVLRARAEKNDLVVEVEDTGIGMRPEDLPRAFAEFVQIDGDLDRRAGGTGLGLPLARSFVELHGGKIWARSEPGKGSTFSFSLPLDGPRGFLGSAVPMADIPQAAGATGNPAETEAAGPRLSDEPRVLIIDGDPETAETIARGLEGAYRVERLIDPRLALLRAQALQPDMVILDVMMPRMDGWEILRGLKAEPSTRHIPVVMCTVLNERALAVSLGAADYIAKPVDIGELRSIAARLAPRGGVVLAVDDDADALEILHRALARGSEEAT